MCVWLQLAMILLHKPMACVLPMWPHLRKHPKWVWAYMYFSMTSVWVWVRVWLQLARVLLHRPMACVLPMWPHLRKHPNWAWAYMHFTMTTVWVWVCVWLQLARICLHRPMVCVLPMWPHLRKHPKWPRAYMYFHHDNCVGLSGYVSTTCKAFVAQPEHTATPLHTLNINFCITWCQDTWANQLTMHFW